MKKLFLFLIEFAFQQVSDPCLRFLVNQVFRLRKGRSAVLWPVEWFSRRNDHFFLVQHNLGVSFRIRFSAALGDDGMVSLGSLAQTRIVVDNVMFLSKNHLIQKHDSCSISSSTNIGSTLGVFTCKINSATHSLTT